MIVDTITILKDLIRIPSCVDGCQNEAALAAYVESFCQRLDGYTVERQAVTNDRFNLIVRNSDDPQVILFGHLDTVLPKNEALKPFTPRVVRNKLFGLGSVDMKAGLAIMLSQAAQNTKLGLGLIFTVDEEYEFKGALKLAQNFHFRPQLIINLEPTNLAIGNGCRGITEFSFTVNGRSAHASRKQLGVNAIEKAVALTNQLQSNISRFDRGGIRNSLNLAYLNGGMLQSVNQRGEKKISGLGMVVPNYAAVNCEIRVANPRLTPFVIEREIIKLGQSLGVKVTDLTFKFYLGSMSTPKNRLKAFERSCRKFNPKPQFKDISQMGYFEVQLLQEKWGSDCVIFGPGPSETAHTANEYVDIQSVVQAEAVVADFIQNNVSGI